MAQNSSSSPLDSENTASAFDADGVLSDVDALLAHTAPLTAKPSASAR